MEEILKELANPGLWAASLRIGTPLLLAALGGLLCMKAKVFQIGLEGFMLVGAFFAIAVIEWTKGNVWMGLLGGIIAGVITSAIYGLVIIRFKADQIVVGIAINLFSYGVTSFLLKAMYGTSGAYRPSVINKIPDLQIPLLSQVPFLRDSIGSHSPMVYFSFVLVVVTYLILFKTPFGLAIQSVGEEPEAARTAGIRPEVIQFLVILWSGALSGLAGAYLSSGIISEFTENMVQGRGFTAFTAIVFGVNHPIWTFLACLLFGFADAMGIRIEMMGGLPSTVLKMFPYILSIFVLAFSAALRAKKRSVITGRIYN